ncbi:MAG: O-antigen ligase family protein [Candidatus Omnitrophota bacterium]
MANVPAIEQINTGVVMLWFDRAVFICLCALVFVLPVSTAGVEFFGYLAIFIFLVNRGIAARRQKMGVLIPQALSPGIILPLVCFLGICGLSILWSVNPRLSIRAFAGKSVGAALLFLTAAGTFTSRERIVRFAWVLLVSAFLVSIDGMWQLWQGHDLFKGELLSAGRVRAAMRHPNGLGAYLIFALLPALALTCWSWTRDARGIFSSFLGRACMVVLTVSLLAVLGLTFSRGAWIGFMVGVSVLGMLRPRYLLSLVLSAGVFLIIFTPMILTSRHVTLLSDSPVLKEFFDVSAIQGSGRLGFWKDALRVIADHPAGTGLNTYTVVIRQYPVRWQAYPHNSYLQMAAEIGVLGLGIFLWFISRVARRTACGVRAASHDVGGVFIVGLFAGWAGIMVQSALDTTFYSVQLSRLLWLAMGLLLAAVFMVEKRSREQGLSREI